MSWWEILIIVAAALFVAGVTAGAVIRKKQGKGGCDECGGGCAGCAYQAACKRSPQESPKGSVHRS